MRKLLSLVVLLLLATLSATAEVVDAVVATVDTEVILHSELMAEVGPALSALPRTSEDEFNRQADKLMSDALQQAIDQKVLYREARQAERAVPEEQAEAWGRQVDEFIEEQLAKIRTSEGHASNEAFIQSLSQRGTTMAELRDMLRKRFIAINFANSKRQEFMDEAVISESEVAQYYQDNADKYVEPRRARVYRIFLTASSDTAERTKVRGRLEELAGELAQGADFGTLARTYSEGPAAENDGLVGIVKPGDLVKELDEAVFSLAEGAVSDVIETKFGFTLVKVDTVYEAGTASLDEMRSTIEQTLRTAYANKRFDKWMSELRTRSRVRVFL